MSRTGAARCRGVEAAFAVALARLPGFSLRTPHDEDELIGSFDDGCRVLGQAPLGPYRADFAFEDMAGGSILAIVEIDEPHHKGRWLQDMQRDRWFTLQRIAVVRFSEDEIRLEAERCAFMAAWFADWLRQSRETEEYAPIFAKQYAREADDAFGRGFRAGLEHRPALTVVR